MSISRVSVQPSKTIPSIHDASSRCAGRATYSPSIRRADAPALPADLSRIRWRAADVRPAYGADVVARTRGQSAARYAGRNEHAGGRGFAAPHRSITRTAEGGRASRG